ncbi:MAG: 4-hydroxy-tetrahydrodipicolinate reductase, partial [Planctomycetes bacterium]|nr:4-hydroxy-tetrahydrodipicolinate reductase [Planctomycetota bacterium]
LKQIEEYSKNAACLVSPNMSIGANLLFKLAGQTAKSLGPDYDIEIVETHHRFKKDAPSGTAKRLAESVTKATGKAVPTHSLRVGDVVGDHMVTYSNLGERIELVHRVHTREVFARGALVAARFIAKAKPGMYTMADVIGK